MSMKISPVIFIFLSIFSALSACKSSQDMAKTFKEQDFPFDSLITGWLGDSICEVFYEPSGVYAYKMRPTYAETDTLIGGYAVDYLIGRLDESCYAVLQFFLKDTANYVLTDESVKTPFSPNIGFEFIDRRHRKVSLLLGFNGNQLKIISQERTVLHKQFKNEYFLLRFTERLIPNNEFIKRELSRIH